jgi:hypothetical protein
LKESVDVCLINISYFLTKISEWLMKIKGNLMTFYDDQVRPKCILGVKNVRLDQVSSHANASNQIIYTLIETWILTFFMLLRLPNAKTVPWKSHSMKKWVFNVLKDKLYLERVCAKMIHLLHICFEGLNTINKKMKANYGIEECISFIAYICVTTILKSPYCKAYFIVIIRRFCNEMRKIATC